MTQTRLGTRKLAKGRALAVLAGALGFGACGDPDTFLPGFQSGQPQGALEGTVTYSGQLPCTEQGHVLGAGILLALDVRQLPPPDGFGTSAASFTTVPGDRLFDSVRAQLQFNADGSRWCPDPGSSVTVSSTWAVGPLAPGGYQVRGFYDRDGNFDPVLSIFKLPTRGDVAGGAIENPAEVLAGKRPRYRFLPLGYEASPGVWKVGPEGAKIGEIAVTFALPMPTHRPMFYSKEIVNKTPVPNPDPLRVVLPADFQLAKANPMDPVALEESFIRLRLGAGVAPPEVDLAANRPFFLPVRDNPFFLYAREDANGDGVIDAKDHVPDSAFVPSLYPMVLFARLPKTPSRAVTGPAVVLQGLTIYKDLNTTVRAPVNLNDPQPEALVALRPSTLCLDPLDVAKPGVLVVSQRTDKEGNPIIADENALKEGLRAKFRRPIDLVYGCLPTGAYAMNVVAPTGQAWTVPNEAGLCAPSEAPSAGMCGSRPQLGSQTAVLTIVPGDPGYCADHPTPPACGP
ncbi:hypothetical protein [Pendulispora albinea]|uniref:Lipoprotein n=1 Tax=Pendulispora albinea TaxID=2741071 RepID=A0ABZ2LW50_9BACT